MTAFVDDIPARADCLDVQAGARWHAIARQLVAEQGPVRALEQFEQARRLAGGTTDRRIGRTVAGQ